MADINNATFTGRLTHDAEQKVLPTGTKLVTFSIANNTGFGEHEKVLFIVVQLWGKTGENIFKYLTKGKTVGVYGELELQKWTDSRDGSNRHKLVLNCNKVILLSGGERQSVQLGANTTEAEEVEAEVVF